MNAIQKIQDQHLNRQALIYIRQSTPKQVQINQESTRRQYELAEKAHQLGWPQPLIKVIDDDLGLSGASSTHRLGFQRLVASISLGEVGMVLVIEVSRLSRLNSDWHRVIELCAVFQTLIADEDGIYDPRDPNDRLVLGLKGTLFAAELHILQARMHGSLLNKARHGELALRLPIGYRRQHDGTVILDPDEQVRQTLQILFEQFSHLRNARDVQRYFYQHEIRMPRLVQQGLDYGKLLWVKPTYQMIQQVLTSPVYAGVFVYGRHKNVIVPGDPPVVKNHRLLMEEWDIVIPDVYPAYIAYDQYVKNRQILRDNMYNFKFKGRGAVREGQGLLQGVLICGQCGRRMTLCYVCRREKLTYAAPQCQSFPMRYLDQAISEIFLQAVQPAQLETMLAALGVLEQERRSLEHQWQLRLERMRYQVQLAQRQYDAVDPDNRLVARELEKRWNDALISLEKLEREYAFAQKTDLAPLEEADWQAVRNLAIDLPALWSASTTTAADRKRLLRLVVREVTLTVEPKTRSATFTVVWSGETTTSHQVTCPPIGWHCVTDANLIQRIRDLATTYPDHRIAEILNTEGLRTQTAKEWTYGRVFSIRKQHHIPTHCPIDPIEAAPRGDGLVSVKTAAQMLNISPALVHLWAKMGVLEYDQRVSASKRWVRVMDADLDRLTGAADCIQLPTIAEVMMAKNMSRGDVWALVRAGQFVAYRSRHGGNWEWRLRNIALSEQNNFLTCVVTQEKGTP
jgi:DNA invertase Pin-like site-specific DNA recombinase